MGGDGGRAIPPSERRTPGQRVVNAVEIEAAIMDVSDRQEEVLGDLVAQAEAAARAEHAFKVKKSVALLQASTVAGNGPNGRTTVDEREAMMIRDTEGELLAHLIADARYEAAQSTLRVLANRMDGLRTIAANIRAQT